MQRYFGFVFVASLLVGSATVHAEALAADSAGKTARAFMSVYGLAEPPSGYLGFCRRHPGECADNRVRVSARTYSSRPELTADRWHELLSVNSHVNELVRPQTDEEIYGLAEFWTYPNGRGDCEDYVLLKRRLLMKRGWPESALLITVVRDEYGEGHAVLTVRTAQGDFILDNKHSRIVRWSETPYQFIKRQSYRNPRLWVSLMPMRDGSSVGAAGSGE